MKTTVRCDLLCTVSLLLLLFFSASVDADPPSGTAHSSYQHPHLQQDELRLIQGITATSNPTLWDLGASGNGINILGIDTGARSSHVDIGLTAAACKNDLHTTTDCSDGSIALVNGHGTAISAVAAAIGSIGTGSGQGDINGENGGMIGVAPDSNIQLIKLRLNSTDGQPGKSTFPVDLNNLPDNNWDTSHVIVLSTNEDYGSTPTDNSRKDQICGKINNFLAGNKLVVLSAGNDSSEIAPKPELGNPTNYPSYCEVSHPAGTDDNKLIIVGATDAAFTARKPDSSYGTVIDIYAPGENIYSAAKTGDTDYANFDGTSFAAPMVAGAASQLLSCGVPVDAIKKHLQEGSTFSISQPAGGAKKRLDVRGALNHAHNFSYNAATDSLTPVSYTLNTFVTGTTTPVIDQDMSTPDILDMTATTGEDIAFLSTTTLLAGCNTFTYTLSTGSPDFSFDSTNGILTFNGSGNASTIITSTDFFGNTISKTINVTTGLAPPKSPSSLSISKNSN